MEIGLGGRPNEERRTEWLPNARTEFAVLQQEFLTIMPLDAAATESNEAPDEPLEELIEELMRENDVEAGTAIGPPPAGGNGLRLCNCRAAIGAESVFANGAAVEDFMNAFVELVADVAANHGAIVATTAGGDGAAIGAIEVTTASGSATNDSRAPRIQSHQCFSDRKRSKRSNRFGFPHELSIEVDGLLPTA